MEVKSPCIGACVFDDKPKLCVGYSYARRDSRMALAVFKTGQGNFDLASELERPCARRSIYVTASS